MEQPVSILSTGIELFPHNLMNTGRFMRRKLIESRRLALRFVGFLATVRTHYTLNCPADLPQANQLGMRRS
jgi:hypothetical protein